MGEPGSLPLPEVVGLDIRPAGPGDYVPLPRAPNGQPRLLVLAARGYGKGKRTVAAKRVTKEETQIGHLLYPERDYWRPKTRADCANVPRPCPYVGCRYNLYLDVNPEKGSMKHNYDCEVWDAAHTCALDLADAGAITLEETGEVMGLTRERVRQIEEGAAARLREEAELPDPADAAHPEGMFEPETHCNRDGLIQFKSDLQARMRERFPVAEQMVPYR